MIAFALMTGLLGVVGMFLVSAQRTVNREEQLGAANDQARLAMEQLDREVRSADFILTLDDSSLLVASQSNAPAQGTRCIQWTIDERELRRRTWPPASPANATAWRTIAEHLVNEDLGEATFELPDTEANRVSTGGRSVEATFLVNTDLDGHPDATIGIEQSLTGRNIAAGSPAAGSVWPPTTPPLPCDVLPS